MRIAILLVVTGCGGGGDGGVGDADSDSDSDGDEPTAPRVVSISPADGGTAYPDAVVTVVFSEEMDADSVAGAIAIEGVPGAVSGEGTTFTFTPAAPLPEQSDQVAVVSVGATSRAGVALALEGRAAFHVGFCEEWTISMPRGEMLANDGVAIGLTLARHACAEPFEYYTTPTLDGADLDAWFLLVGGEWGGEPLDLPDGGDATLYVNLFCVPEEATAPGAHELGLRITRWIQGEEEDPVVGQATSAVDLARGEVRHPDTAATGVYDLPWDPSERANVAPEPYADGVPVAAAGTTERSVTATVWDADGTALEEEFPYMVSLPAGYDADDDSDAALHGLVFVLQGWGVSYRSTSGISALIDEAGRRGYLFVHPQGSWYWDPQSPGLQGGPDPTQRGDFGCHVGWIDYQMRISDPLAFGLDPDGGDHNNHDWYSPVLQAVAEDVVRAFTFDPARVHAMGFSCGAAYAFVLAAWYPDRFASVILDEPNPSPIYWAEDERVTAPLLDHARRPRYLFVAGEDSLGDFATRFAAPLLDDFYCWDGEVRTFPGGHSWYMNLMPVEAADFLDGG